MHTSLTRTALSAAILAASLVVTRNAMADAPYAEPPPGREAVAVVARSPDEPPPEPPPEPLPASTVRLFVGPAGKLSATGAQPGLLAAVELGRGPTGVRVAGAWVDVGSDRGLAEYTGELTIDFGGQSRIHPEIGAGGGVARTSSSKRADGSMDASTGATLGVGVVRGGVSVRLPFEEADARMGLDISGSFPVVRSEGARDVPSWALASLTIGIGF